MWCSCRGSIDIPAIPSFGPSLPFPHQVKCWMVRNSVRKLTVGQSCSWSQTAGKESCVLVCSFMLQMWWGMFLKWVEGSLGCPALPVCHSVCLPIPGFSADVPLGATLSQHQLYQEEWELSALYSSAYFSVGSQLDRKEGRSLLSLLVLNKCCAY